MRRALLALAALSLLSTCAAEPAFAKHPKHHKRHTLRAWDRPAEWCGWFMRRQFGVSTPAANVALWWRRYGRPAQGPAVGRIVIWSHGRGLGHVGVITGRSSDGWVVRSGNDGGAVRERVRRVDNAVAFREP